MAVSALAQPSPLVDGAELVVRNHDVFAICGTGDQPFVIGAKAGALPPLDGEIEIAIEQVAELHVGQGEVGAAKIGRVRQLLLRDVEIVVEERGSPV